MHDGTVSVAFHVTRGTLMGETPRDASNLFALNAPIRKSLEAQAKLRRVFGREEVNKSVSEAGLPAEIVRQI